MLNYPEQPVCVPWMEVQVADEYFHVGAGLLSDKAGCGGGNWGAEDPSPWPGSHQRKRSHHLRDLETVQKPQRKLNSLEILNFASLRCHFPSPVTWTHYLTHCLSVSLGKME